jgi:hypothetical protein
MEHLLRSARHEKSISIPQPSTSFSHNYDVATTPHSLNFITNKTTIIITVTSTHLSHTPSASLLGQLHFPELSTNWAHTQNSALRLQPLHTT